MKICISTLPPTGKPVDHDMSLPALNKRVDRADLQFTSTPRLVGRVERQASGAFLRATVTAEYTQECGFCNEPKPRTARTDIALSLRPFPFHHAQTAIPDKHEFDDVGVSYFDNDVVDIEPIAQEFLILSLDLWWRCPQCEGS